MNAIEIKNLSVVLSGKEILKDINLSLEEGKFLGIVGPNGSGKTTFLKSILGIIKYSTGEVRVLGKSSEECLREGV
ncbi:MAG: ATP-binding cassette domain-containing protein, partial [Nitrospirae bacterium]|nr:ATP-binding cassette domain-containing protein [Nitrospirota bacterium]